VNTKNTEVPANTFVTVALVSKTKSISLLVPCTAGWFKEMSERCRDVSGGNGDRTWSLYIPKNAAPGVYKIEVSFWSKQSDHFFIARAVSENTITISRTPYQEVIVIRSPRQGEILGAGTTYRIEWETPVTNISKFTIFAVSDGTALMSIELTPAEAKCFQGSSKMICSYVWIPRIARENVKLSITDGTNKTELAPLTIMSF
jgi:hypothetical protein